MTKRQFTFGIFILLTILTVSSLIGYFTLENRKINVQEQKIQADVEKYQQDEKTTRTKERFKFLPNFRRND